MPNRIVLILPSYNAQNGHVGDLYMFKDELFRQTVERAKTPYTPFKQHMPDGQVKPIEQYFPKVTQAEEAKPKKETIAIVPKERLPKGCFYVKGIGIREKKS